MELGFSPGGLITAVFMGGEPVTPFNSKYEGAAFPHSQDICTGCSEKILL